MKPKPRWMKSVIEAAKSHSGPLPTGRRLEPFEATLKAAAPAKA